MSPSRYLELTSCSAVLKEILSGEATENVVSKIHDYLTLLGETVRSGTVPLDDFIIFKVSRVTRATTLAARKRH